MSECGYDGCPYEDIAGCPYEDIDGFLDRIGAARIVEWLRNNYAWMDNTIRYNENKDTIGINNDETGWEDDIYERLKKEP